MLNKFFFPFFLLFFILISKHSHSNENIAFIDLNYILNNSVAGKKLNNQISNKSEKIKKEFSDFKKKIDSEKEKLSTQKNVLSQEEYQKSFQKLQNQVNEYNLVITQKNKDLSDFTNKAKIEFSNELKVILEEYSKENSISMILRKENLLIAKNSLDVTKGILDLFDKKIKEIIIK